MADQPIPVTDALRALEREIAVCDGAVDGPWTMSWAESKASPDEARFIVHARNGYRAALEYIHGNLTRFGSDLLMEGDCLYAAVAPIVARWREEDKR